MVKRGYLTQKNPQTVSLGKNTDVFVVVVVHNLRLMELVWMICFKCWMLYLGLFFWGWRRFVTGVTNLWWFESRSWTHFSEMVV